MDTTRTASLTLSSVNLAADDVAQLPDAERGFLLLAGHLHNEIAILNKMVVWSISAGSRPTSHDVVEGSQALFIAKLLGGKVCEAWDALEVGFFGNRISRVVVPLLKHEPNCALQTLKTYFGTQNLIRRLRNDYAFHYTPSDIGAAWNGVAAEPGFEILIGDTSGNTFHLGAELAANSAMLNAINASSRNLAMESFFEEIRGTAGNLMTFLDGAIFALIEKCRPSLTTDSTRTIPLHSTMESTWIPFFVEMPADDGR